MLVVFASWATAGCGSEEDLQDDLFESQAAIINGTAYSPDDVGLVKLTASNDASFLCSGTMLNDRLILTARQCAGRVLDTYRVTIGSRETDSGARIDLASTHPSLDVALLRSTIPIKHPSTGKTFANSLYGKSPQVLLNRTLDCRGYGRSTRAGGAGVLRQGSLPVIAWSATSLTTGRNAAGQVQFIGDYGGPCFYTDAGVRYVVGVASSSRSDGSAVYDSTLVAASAFVRWVSPMTADYTGDGRDDFALWLRDTAEFSIKASYGGSTILRPLGELGDVPVNGDWDGDGKADLATYRPSLRRWRFIYSSNNQVTFTNFGDAGDKPLAGDLDGDGRTDLVTFGGGIFKVRESSGRTWTREWSAPDELPVIGDYDGDGRDDIGTWKNGWWTVQTSLHSEYINDTIGASGDLPVPGDYDGDRKNDVAVWRPTTGVWTIKRSFSGTTTTRAFGAANDVPVPGDYDGDGATDLAYYRPSNRTWNVLRSSDGATSSVSWGVSNAIPVQSPLGNR